MVIDSDEFTATVITKKGKGKAHHHSLVPHKTPVFTDDEDGMDEDEDYVATTPGSPASVSADIMQTLDEV
jgi:hypothetical protein